MGKVTSINRNNLRIARENMGFDTQVVSKTITTSSEDVVHKWEKGEAFPTWAQVKRLSNKYKTPELLFFGEKQITKNRVLHDFRTGLEEIDKDKVKKLINLVLKRQRWVEERMKREKYPGNSLIGSGKDISSPKNLARFISKKLDIDLAEIRNISGKGARRKALKYLAEKAEDKKIFVGKTISYHDIEVEDMRGLFISNSYAPFIIINRRDSVSAQIFTLIHELAHLFRSTEGISNVDFRELNSFTDKEEVFCNKVSAELLLPEEDFTKEEYSESNITKLSILYKVSEIFIFYRLKSLGKINKADADSIERSIKNSIANILSDSGGKSTGGDYNNNMKDSNGRLLNTFVSNAYLENKIGYIEASKILNFSVEKYG